MISECAADILAKVQAVAGIAAGSGAALSLGGRSADPGLLKVPLPAAWVTLREDETAERDYTHGHESGVVIRAQPMMLTFAVTIWIPYSSDEDLLEVQFPLLEAVIGAVHASDCTVAGYRWRYIGQRIALVHNDRLAYEQRYTLNATYTDD